MFFMMSLKRKRLHLFLVGCAFSVVRLGLKKEMDGLFGSVIVVYCFVVAVSCLLVDISRFPSKITIGNAYEEDVPEEDVPEEGTGLAGYDPFTGSSVPRDEPDTGTGIVGGVPQTGTGIGTGTYGDDPAQIVSKALLCFNDKQIYSSCEESYRLTEAGNLNVPSEYVDQYCNGPCLKETHLVLNCLQHIMTHFLFYNKATVHDIKDTIKAGCSYGPERGNFDVAEHIQAEENIGYKTLIQILPVIAFGIIANALFL